VYRQGPVAGNSPPLQESLRRGLASLQADRQALRPLYGVRATLTIGPKYGRSRYRLKPALPVFIEDDALSVQLIPPAAIVLAAGQGKRMQSDLPKVLHACGGLPLICHVVRCALSQGCSPVVVVVSPQTQGPVQETLAAHFPEAPLAYAVQAVPQGTGDAARVGLEQVPEDSGQVVILYGDVPLLQGSTLQRLRKATQKNPLAVLTAQVARPDGYGRIVRDAKGHVACVVEDKDTTPEQRAITEINAGVYWVHTPLLRRALSGLTRNNAQNELYLTDVVAAAAASGGAQAVAVAQPDEVRGVNSRMELGLVEGILRRRLVAAHQARGVSFVDPEHVVLGVDVTLGRDVIIGPGVQLLGQTHIEANVRIEGPSVLIDTHVGTGSVVRSFCHLESAHVGHDANVGPYARLRPAARLEAKARVGNFVEIKNATLHAGAKANHLAYVGDAEVGAGANLGAGTITCNYDGFNKHRTQVGAGAFVGSNSTLVAPVHVGDEAFVAAGSCITDDVPADALAFGRAKQVNREGMAATLRARLEKQKAARGKGPHEHKQTTKKEEH
jgi:bifunctional UDP-N-acetylglucosamine pyrophosphorylase/glucosamine-1-phosphate N-acetyltransferase